jgi:extradiol dioxygenase family protein
VFWGWEHAIKELIYHTALAVDDINKARSFYLDVLGCQERDDWHELVDTLKAKAVDFRIEPNIKDHEGIGKVGNMFVADPSGNFVEFKSYQDKSMVL